MDGLIDYIGSAILIIGLVIHFSLGFDYGLWKPYFKKVRLLKKQFTKVVCLLGISAFVAGSGMTIIVLANSQTGNWPSRLFTIALCSLVYPTLQTGVFVFHMRREGFVQRTEHE